MGKNDDSTIFPETPTANNAQQRKAPIGSDPNAAGLALRLACALGLCGLCKAVMAALHFTEHVFKGITFRAEAVLL